MHDKTLIPLIFRTVFENTPCLNTFLVETIARKLKIDKKNKKKLSDKIRYLVKKLEKHGFIITKRISKKLYYIFPAPQFSQDSKADPTTQEGFDWILKADARNSPETSPKPESTDEKTDIKHAYDVVATPRYPKAHETWFVTACKYWRKTTLTDDDIELIKEKFDHWKADVSEKVMLFLRPDGYIEIKDYKTRFTSKSEAVKILKKAEEIFNNAFKEYDKAIFLTITLPRCFPLKVAMYILTFLHHRVKAYIRKHTGEKTPHFRVNEPQKAFYPHIHSIIFGTDWLMPKWELTRYLDKHLENFLSNMGEHYKRTINKRATDEDVRALNKLGKRLLKKYKGYKKKHTKYEGVINWITKVRLEDGKPVFDNPPPDYKSGDEFKGMARDGGKPLIWDYLKKYILKNVYQAKKEEEGDYSGKEESRLAWYWLLRVPFYSCSNNLRPQKQRPPPQGWIFLFSTYEVNLQDALEYAEWLAERA